MSNKVVLPTAFEPYLFSDIRSGFTRGAGSSGVLYGTLIYGDSWYNSAGDHEAYPDYGRAFIDGAGRGEMISFTIYSQQDVTFRHVHLKERILQSWSRS